MHYLTRSQRVIQHECALLDGVSMLCNKCLGGDKPGDASTHNDNVLQAAFVLFDLPCDASLGTRCVYESDADAEFTGCESTCLGFASQNGMQMFDRMLSLSRCTLM